MTHGSKPHKSAVQRYRRSEREVCAPDPQATLEQVVEQHAGLVRRVARRIARRCGGAVDLDDLISAGMIGLIDAWQRYDASGGRTFEVYAEFRVRGAILDELRRLDPMTQPMRRRARKIEAARNRLRSQLGREPTEDQLAEALQTPVDKLRRELDELQPIQFVPDDDLVGLASDLGKRAAERADLRAVLERALERLDERSRIVLALSYVHDLTLREIGEVLELTEARICQIRSKALRTLRAQLRDADGHSEA